MLRILNIIFLFAILIGCKPDEEIIDSNFTVLPIVYSSDSLLFDTLITNTTTSITKRLVVYNTSPNAIILDSVYVGNLFSSPFSIYINGIKGSVFKNIKILGGDSLLVMVNASKSPFNNDNLFILTDSVNVVSNYLRSSVILNTWGQDAYFHTNDTIKSTTNFNSNKPHVVYGNLVVNKLAILNIESGSKLMFYNSASLVVNGELNILGTKDSKVEFSSFRTDGKYESLPAQWQGIYFFSNSNTNTISWLNLSNSINGLYFDDNSNCNTIVSNSFFSNVSKTAIYSSRSNLTMKNCVFYRTMDKFIDISGGEFNAYYNSFDNNNVGFNNATPSVFISDSKKSLVLNFINNIVSGDLLNELQLSITNTSNVFVNNNIIKSDVLDNYLNNIFYSKKSEFRFRKRFEYDFKPDTLSITPLLLSPSYNSAISIGGISNELDYNGNYREILSDIGAIEIY